MKADLEQLEEMQKDLFRQQCDLDIQKAMLKHFIKKKEDEQLTLTDVSQRSELYFAFMEEYNALMGKSEHQILKEEVIVLLAKYSA
tara:strand:+ start:28 stop:285 length:258 start_codon:yes stop_codon:yes gene_type:complete